MINTSGEALNPAFLKKVQAFFAEARAEGLDVYIFEGFRSKERQWELFGKGRTVSMLRKYGVPDKYANPKAKVVTWTLQSNHLTGNAIDVVFDTNKDPKVRAPSWNGNYRRLIEISKKHGIRNLAPAELCHFENIL